MGFRKLVIETSIVLVMVAAWTVAKQTLESTKDQSVMLEAIGDDPQCSEHELPCEYNFVIIQDDLTSAELICDEGYSYPDGRYMQTVMCERVTGKDGRVTARWSQPSGKCRPVQCPPEQIENGLVMGNDTTEDATQLVMCNEGHSFPDGDVIKERTCVQMYKERRYVVWTPRLENCVAQ